MPSYGQTVTLQYVAWDTSANAGKTGDVGNHTLKWIKDGTAATPTNSPAEVDATNAPGIYKLVMTATECQCQVGTLAGKSGTSNIVILPITVTFENLPTTMLTVAGIATGVWQDTTSGDFTVSGSIGKGLYNSGGAPGQPGGYATLSGAGVIPADVQTIKTQTVTCGAGVSVGAYVGNATAAISVNASGAVLLQGAVKKNTALAAFEFPMIDSSDHVSRKTGATVTLQRSLDGASFGAAANSVTEVSTTGIYKVNLAAGDLNGDTVTLLATASGCDDTIIELLTQP